MSILHQDKYTFLIISRSVLLKMINVLDKSYRETKNSRFIVKQLSSKMIPFIR